MNAILSLLTRYDETLAEGLDFARQERRAALVAMVQWIGPRPTQTKPSRAGTAYEFPLASR